MPADVPAPTYKSVDWSWLADLPGQFYQGAQQKQQYDQSTAFQNGLPLDANGNPDWAQITQTLAKLGNTQNIPQLAKLSQDQRTGQAIQNTNPLDIALPGADGGPQLPLTAPNPAAVQSAPLPPPAQPAPPLTMPLTSNPPASATGVISTKPAPTTTSRSSAKGSVATNQDGGGTTLSQLVSALPNPDGRLQAPANIAHALSQKFGIDPNTPLTPDQLAYAKSVIGGYAERNGQMQPSGGGLLANGGMRAEARGIRNNNADNISDGSFARSQPGYVGAEPQGRFAKFATPEDGLNAASALLGNYGKQGINTINGIVSKWAPASDGNNVANYSGFVAKQLGVDPDQPLNMADPGVRKTVASAMAKFESGGTGTETGRSAAATGVQGQQPGAQQGEPLVPRVPLPKGFTDPEQAIMALREKAAQFGSQYGTNPAAKYNVDFWNAWADKIENSITPMKIGDKEVYVNPQTGQPVYQGQSVTNNAANVRSIADAIQNGDQAPVLTSLYGQAGPVRAELERRGVPLAKYQLQYKAAEKQIASLNGPQMTRFVGLASSVNSTIDEVRDLSKQLDMSGVPLFNKTKLAAYIQAAGNTENGQLAARYIGAVNTLKEEFANLAQGGYAPTESVWKLANDQVNGNYGVKELGASLDEIQRLINYRINAIPNLSTMGPGAANRYTGNPGIQPSQNAAPQQSASPQSSQSMPHVSSQAEYDALPKGTKYIYPDGSVREK